MKTYAVYYLTDTIFETIGNLRATILTKFGLAKSFLRPIRFFYASRGTKIHDRTTSMLSDIEVVLKGWTEEAKI